MTDTTDNLPDLQVGRPNSKQAIYSSIASHAKDILGVLLYEMKNGDSSAARVGAAKTLVNKIVPDLKSMDISSEEGIKFLIQIVQDNKLKDANTDNPVTSEELRSTGENLQLPNKV